MKALSYLCDTAIAFSCRRATWPRQASSMSRYHVEIMLKPGPLHDGRVSSIIAAESSAFSILMTYRIWAPFLSSDFISNGRSRRRDDWLSMRASMTAIAADFSVGLSITVYHTIVFINPFIGFVIILFHHHLSFRRAALISRHHARTARSLSVRTAYVEFGYTRAWWRPAFSLSVIWMSSSGISL